MLTASLKPAPRLLPDAIKLTVTGEPADVKSPDTPSMLNGDGMKLYSSLVQDAVSASPTAGISMSYLGNMFSPRKKQPTSKPDMEARVEQLKLLGVLVDRL